MDGGRQGNKRRVGAARRRSRGHGPARLDGARARATVADKVMKSGETAGHGNGLQTRRPHGKRSAQARSWKPGRRRQPSGARERWKPEGGETPQAARCEARERDRPSPRDRGRPALKAEETTRSGRVHARHRGSAANAVWPIRPSRVGGFQGRQACAAGIARRAFPWRASRRRAGIAPRGRDAKGRPATPQGRVRQRHVRPAAHRAHRRSIASRRETTNRARSASPARRAPSPVRPG